MESAAFGSFTTATDLADYLVTKGLPFRDSHEITGNVVKFCIENGYDLKTLPLPDYRRFCDKIEKNVYEKVSLESSVEAKISLGGTCKSEVERQINNAIYFLKRLND